jgi:Calcineurin-like phosphoesterase
VLVGAGDIANCNSPGDEATARLLDGIGGTIFTAGDNAYMRGSASEFRDCYGPSWGRHRDRTYPTPGNHDYDSNDGARGYFDYFGDRAGPRGLGYYAYDVGTWRIYALNSEFEKVPGLGQSQMDWLRGELTSRPAPCSIAVWHKPLFTSGPNGDNPHMRDIFRLLYDNGVDVVLNGHDHLYERFAPQDASGRVDPARGIRQFTVGTGGVDTYTNPRVAPNSERILSVWGVFKLTLHTNSYDWEFVPVDPGFRDSGSGSCH